jgi:membrane-bound metal-dependent hydrolase YbcI (DUF457 family)
MNVLRLPYYSSFAKMAISGVFGAWMHILFDAPLYYDIKPFYPLSANPLYGSISINVIYTICEICLVLAVLIYIFLAFKK